MTKQRQDENDMLPEDETEGESSVQRLSRLLSHAASGEKLLIYRQQPGWIKGPVDEIEISEGMEPISWMDLERRHGGGRYRIILQGPGGKYISSANVDIPGPPKWRGQYVQDETDLARMVQEAKGKGEPAGMAVVLSDSLKQFGQMLVDSQNRSTEMLLSAIREGRSQEPREDPLMVGIKALGMLEKVNTVIGRIADSRGRQVPELSGPEEPATVSGPVEEKILTILVEKGLEMLLKPKAPVAPVPVGSDIPPHVSAKDEPPLSEDELKEIRSS